MAVKEEEIIIYNPYSIIKIIIIMFKYRRTIFIIDKKIHSMLIKDNIKIVLETLNFSNEQKIDMCHEL